MKNSKLFEAITQIRDSYLLEALPRKNRFYRLPGKRAHHMKLRYPAVAAAAFVLIFLGIGITHPAFAQNIPILNKIVSFLQPQQTPPVVPDATEDNTPEETQPTDSQSPIKREDTDTQTESQTSVTPATEQNTQTSTTQAAEQNVQTEISSIAIDPDSQSIAVTIRIPDSGTNTPPHYWIDHMSTFRTDTQPYAHGILLSMYGFYTEDAAWKKPQIYEGYASPDSKGNALPDVMVSAEVSHMPAKTFTADVEKTTLPIRLTSYGISFQPTDDWRTTGHFYTVTATAKDGTQYRICMLPLLDDRKASEKRKHPLPETDADLEELGDGIYSGAETDHCGGQYIFNSVIDPEQIESIELTPLYP